MLASPATEPPEGPDWIAEVKWDGYRAIAIIEQSKVRLLSRNGLSLGKKFGQVVTELESLDFDSAILDGEVVAVDQDGPRFELLQRYQQKPQCSLMAIISRRLMDQGRLQQLRQRSLPAGIFAIVGFVELRFNPFHPPKFVACPTWVLLKVAVSLGKITVYRRLRGVY